jgi:hypothetical protein
MRLLPLPLRLASLVACDIFSSSRCRHRREEAAAVGGRCDGCTSTRVRQGRVCPSTVSQMTSSVHRTFPFFPQHHDEPWR